MTNKTFWIGVVVVYVVMQGIGFLIHGVWLADTYEGLASVFRPEAEMTDMMWMMYVSGAVAAYMFCFIFTKGYEGTGVMEGVRYGALIGILMAGTGAVDAHVIYPVPANLASMWLISGLVSFMIAGGVFAAIYKPGASGR